MTRLAVFLYLLLVVVLVSAPRVFASQRVTCDGTLARSTSADVIVPAGAVCRMNSYTVQGSVTVLKDAYFEARDTKIDGNIEAHDALTLFLRDGTSVRGSVHAVSTPQVFVYRTSVAGKLSISDAGAPGYGHVQVCDSGVGPVAIFRVGPDLLFGDPRAGCMGNRVHGSVLITENDVESELTVWGNTVGADLLIAGNGGAALKQVRDNQVRGRYQFSGNSVPAEESGNVYHCGDSSWICP